MTVKNGFKREKDIGGLSPVLRINHIKGYKLKLDGKAFILGIIQILYSIQKTVWQR